MDSDSLRNLPVVVDCGSSLLKAGIAGTETPSVLLPSLVGREKHPKVMPDGSSGGIFVGKSLNELRGILRLSRPINHGYVTNWADLEYLFQHTYSALNSLPEQHPLLVTETPLNPSKSRAQMSELCFESLGVPSLYVQMTAILSLYASGRTTGVVLDCGDGVTSAVPVYKGYILPHAVRRSEVAGRSVTHYLSSLLRKSGCNLYSPSHMLIVENIKQTVCDVAIWPQDPEGSSVSIRQRSEDTAGTANPSASIPERKGSGSTMPSSVSGSIGDKSDVHDHTEPYKLPDGQVIQLGRERYLAPEALFDPSLTGSDYPGVHKLLEEAIGACDIEIRRAMYGDVVLAGGSTRFAGFGNRLLRELRDSTPKDTRIKIWASAERLLSAWVGGSILASLSTFQDLWVTRQQYEEQGKERVDSVLANKAGPKP